MKTLNWYYPASLTEAAELVGREKIVPHAGGTGLLARGLGSITGLIELSRLPLHDLRITPDSIEIGSLCTYRDVVNILGQADPGHILVEALRESATTPLRNRITVGGSIALAPPWSDITGPLLALDTELVLLGDPSGTFPVAEYLQRSELRTKTLIQSVRLTRQTGIAAHYRHVRTRNDLPAFTITVLFKVSGGLITDCRIIIVGATPRYARQYKIENWLKQAPVDQLDDQAIQSLIEAKFGGRRIADPVYARHIAGIEIVRCVQRLMRNCR